MSFHGYSEDEESPILQNFVNETIARQSETPSPRTELLSPTSPQALQGEIDRVRRSQRGPSERYRRQREQAYANFSSRQLLSLLIEKEYESSKLRKALHRAFDRFEAEAVRVAEAEHVTRETLNQFRAATESRIAAERALGKTNEELRLWKFQFDHAQGEVARAQEVVRLVERQREDAERAATKARTAARQLSEQRLVSDALEEGRKLGFQAGFRRAQQEMTFRRDTTPADAYQDWEREEIEDGRVYSAPQPEDDNYDSENDGSPSQALRDLNASPVPPTRPPQDIRMPNIPPSHPPTTEAPPPSMPVPAPAMAMPSPIPASGGAFATEASQHAPPSRSSSIQLSLYPIDIPSPSVLNDIQPSNQQRRRPLQAQERPQYQELPPPPESLVSVQRPPSQTQYQQPRSTSVQDAPVLSPQEQSYYQEQPQYRRAPSPDPVPIQRRPLSQAQHQRPRSTSVRDAPVLSPQEQSYYQEQPRYQRAPPPDPVPIQRRPLSQAQHQRPRSTSVTDAPPRRPSPQEQSYHQPPPDNYIPSISAEGGISLPPPFQLSHPVMATVHPPTDAQPQPTQSWYNRDRDEQQGQQSWYQPKRPRSNAGSATGRSAAGSAAGRSTTGRHTRQASLDSRLSAKNQKLAAEYGTDLGAIREDARSVRSGKGYGEGSQRARSMRAPSTESLVPPPLPEKDARHRKQLIADELRYSDPDLAESWRRDAAANADTSSSKSRPPRNVRVPANLKFPSPLSPPTGPVSLGHMRARTMSGSTGKSGWTQPPNPVDLVSRPSLRRVKERRPISPSDLGSPEFGTIRVEPPSQSSSQVPLVNATPHMDRYLSPNYQMQPLGQPQAGSGFVPQSVTIPAQITVPVTFKGKAISSPMQASIPFPAESGDADYSQFRPQSGYGGSTTSLSRARDASAASFNAEERPLSRVRSTSALSRKSGKSGKTEYAGPTLTPGHGLQRQASNTSLRSTGSAYARFDAKSYVDPAYFAADTSAGPIPVPAPRSRRGSASSRHSGLSYIGPP